MLQVFRLPCKQQSSEVPRAIGDTSKFGSCSYSCDTYKLVVLEKESWKDM